MAQPAFKVDSYIRKTTEGAIEIDIIPDNPKAELSPQQVLDIVTELVSWYWEETSSPEGRKFDS